MSSKIEVQRICNRCGKEFVARTTVTQYCSHKCSSAAYKERFRATKVELSNNETKRIKSFSDLESTESEFLTVREVARLLRCSIRTLYYSIECGKIKAVNFGQRITRIKRSELDRLFEQPAENLNKIKKEPKNYEVEGCYNLTEISDKYGISEKALHDIINREHIDKIRIGRFAYVPKELIDKIMS